MTPPDPLTEVREHLIAALEADFVGPFHPQLDAKGNQEIETGQEEAPEEVLPLRPSRWYLTGFLAPQTGRELDTSEGEDETMDAAPEQQADDTSGSEPEPKRKNFLPASLGLSVLLPPGDEHETLRVTLSYGEYQREPNPIEDEQPKFYWRRVARPPVSVDLPLQDGRIAAGVHLDVPDQVWIGGKLANANAPGLDPGTRALSLFVVNHRQPGGRGRQEERFLFQVGLELEYERGFTPRPIVRDADPEWDERVSDLHYRHAYEYAVGHGVAVHVPDLPRFGLGTSTAPITRLRTTWIPRAEVPRVKTHDFDGVETEMEKLANLDAEGITTALGGLAETYRQWLDEQRTLDPGSDARRETRDQLIDQANLACDRIAEGVDLLRTDAEVLEAFRLANRAMHMQAMQGNPGRYAQGARPSWYLFQLAFLLLNLPSVADDAHQDRERVELIFFPTGGGKTEAYLGVIAFTLVLRRMRGIRRPDQGLGVAVLLRYTLRLLTLDQLGRAATLICALEVLRRQAPDQLGEIRFAVGLWVGKSATANTMKEIAQQVAEYKDSSSPTASSPFPLQRCPWCQTELTDQSLKPIPAKSKTPTELIAGCANFRCDFAPGRHPEGLPVLIVDEQIYRELPAFLVATVDKFAMLPWRGETGMLFGRASHRDGRCFQGPLDAAAKGEPLPEGLRPPELIVQDELHLISGPLGTMVGLYETAIEELCTRREDGSARRPKILASTATVRRAREQVQALFGRPAHAVFPPPAVDASETFFSTIDQDSPGRLYIGLAAPGRALKALLLRTYVSLICGAQHCYGQRGPDDATADAYMTVAGYFNSLRELGGMRRLVEDEASQRCTKIEKRQPVKKRRTRHPWYRNRNIAGEPVELTSREGTAKIKQAKDRLNLPHREKGHVDVLVASNMISVGVDIDRLGLMVVAGQPKTTAEYIQASSRVGRQPNRPGLVVTCFNVHRPRDRSQYEHFTAYHQSFYRHVEATSLTPFSAPAIERGLAGTVVAMARLLNPALTPPGGVMDLADHPDTVARVARVLARRGGLQPGAADTTAEEKSLRQLVENLLDAWKVLIRQAISDSSRRYYSKFDREKARGDKALLYTILDENRPDKNTDEAKFAAPTSMRDVEPSVHLWLHRNRLGGSF